MSAGASSPTTGSPSGAWLGGRLVDVLERIAAGLAVGYVALYLGLVCLRIAHPLELEWMEGSLVTHVARVLSGEPLFVAPTFEYTPYLYAPLFYWIAAIPAKLLGVGFLPLRLVSVVASLATMALLFEIVRRETGRIPLGLLAAGFFAACYRIGGVWYDVGRVDSLFVTLLVAALFALRYQGPLSSGIVVALAIWSKQTTFTALAPVLLFVLWWRGLRYVVLHCAVITLAFFLPVVVWHVTSDGWSTYYLFELARAHPVLGPMFGYYWNSEVFAQIPWPLLFGTGVLGTIAWRSPSASDPAAVDDRTRSGFWLSALAGAVLASVLSLMHSGGWKNVLFPTYALFAIALGLGLGWIEGIAGRRARAIALAFTVAQLLWLAYDPRPLVPTKENREAGLVFIEAVRALPGEVYLPEHDHLAVLAGKRPWSHMMMLGDVLRGADSEAKDALEADLHRVISAQTFTAIIVHPQLTSPRWLRDAMAGSYELVGPFPSEDSVFGPVVGRKSAPRIYRPVSAAPPRTKSRSAAAIPSAQASE